MCSVSLPDSASIAISHQLNDNWQLLSDVTWTNWSRIQNVPLILQSARGAIPPGTVADILDLQFRDSWRVGLGANYRWTDNFMLQLGVAYDKTPVPDAAHRAVFLPDSDRTWLALGGKYQINKANTLDFGYAHIFMKGGDTLRSKGVGAAAGLQGVVSGTFSKQHIDIFSVQYTYSF